MESRGIKNYPKRFQSAEGCYSHRATQLMGVRIKVAHKQFVGLSVPSDDQIFAINGAVWQCPREPAVDVKDLAQHSTQPCSADLPGVQEPLGDMLPLQVTPDGGCGKWMPVEVTHPRSEPPAVQPTRDPNLQPCDPSQIQTSSRATPSLLH